jgi:hypothetical protein
MEIENLGHTWDAGYRMRAKCAWGKRREGLKSVRECGMTYELDVQTMLWTRGRAFPVSALSTRLRCPWCGSRLVTVTLIPPEGSPAAMPVRLLAGR